MTRVPILDPDDVLLAEKIRQWDERRAHLASLPHDAELFALLTHPAIPDEPYPAAADIDQFVQASCVPLWEAYTGRTWATEIELTISFLQPTVADWAEGDRSFSCYTARYGGGKLTTSVKNIATSPLPAQTP